MERHSTENHGSPPSNLEGDSLYQYVIDPLDDPENAAAEKTTSAYYESGRLLMEEFLAEHKEQQEKSLMAFSVPWVDVVVEDVIERRRATARYHFRLLLADMLSTRRFVASYLDEVPTLGWLRHPGGVMAELPSKEKKAIMRFTKLRRYISRLTHCSTRPTSTSPVTPSKKLQELEAKIQFLEHQLRSERLDLQLYRLGGGSFLVAAASLLVWTFTGIAAPFHPMFAAVATPVSVAVMGMAFLVRREAKKERASQA